MEPLNSRARGYKDAVKALNSLQSNFATIEATKKLGPSVNRNEVSLREVYEYTRRLGYKPEDFNKLNLIHVTGTKGKGLTCAFTESILSQYQGSNGPIGKIGLFTSPHLKSVRERIRINGQPINELKFAKYFFDVWDRLSSTESSPDEFPHLQPCNEVKPMYFKYLTIMSFHVFMSEGVDTAIYEVGIGGHYDSTNIIDTPVVTGISSLGIDHTFMLGNTIESITWNKTGIFKKGVPAVVSEQVEHPEAIEFIKERAKERQVSSLEIVSPNILPTHQKLGLAGDFQRQNAALAVKLAAIRLEKLGVPLDELPNYEEALLPDKFISGLEKTQWPGRCQIIKDKPGFEKITWYIDGAHTIESMAVASKWFAQQMETSKPAANNIKVLLFNQQNRENAGDLLVKLYEVMASSKFRFNHVIFTTNVTWSSGDYNADLVSMNTSKDLVDKLVVQKMLAGIWSELDQKNNASTRKHILHEIETSANFIKSLTNEADVDVFVCGSLHLVGGVLVVLDNEHD